MPNDLNTLRQTWRPRLAHDVVWMCRVILPLDFLIFYLRPEVAAHAVSLTVAVFGFAAALFGLRQWGKNTGAE